VRFKVDPLPEKLHWIDRRLAHVRSGVLTRRACASRSSQWGSALRQAHRHLYAAQSAKGCFELADPHSPQGKGFRREIYQHLLKAERALDTLETRSRTSSCTVQGRLLLRSKALTVLIDAERGGGVLELSDKVAERNLCDTWVRERGVGRQAGFMDHALPLNSDVRTFACGRARELGDFKQGRYVGRIVRTRGQLQAVLRRTAPIRLKGARHSVSLTKTIGLTAQGRTLSVAHELINRSSRPISFLFGSQLCLTLKDAHVNRMGEAQGIRRFALVDPAEQLQVSWAFSRAARFWHFPMETTFGATSRRIRSYQGVNLTFLWPIRLAPRGSWKVRSYMAIGEPNGGC